MKRKIVVDSSSNMYSYEGVDFESVPLKIRTNDKEYVDDANLDVNGMVEDLRSYKGKSSTACPSPGEWLDAFGDADEVFCVTITSGLSGSYDAAMTAKNMYEEEHPGRKVYVLDSRSAGPELKLQVDKLKELIEQGKDFETISEEVFQYKEKKVNLCFSLESLRNLANNGRVPQAVALITGVLGIRMVGEASVEGKLDPTDKCRGEKKALATLFANMKRLGYKGARVVIDHCYNEEAAGKLKEIITEEFAKAKVLIERTGGLCSFYAEKGGLMVAFELD